jgi:hypothetical protein
MTELEVLIQINSKLDVLMTISTTLSTLFATLLLFEFIKWVRHLVAIWKRGNGWRE